MTYIVKNTYEKPGADVLLEYFLGPVEKFTEIMNDPRVVKIDFFRSTDRSYAQCYLTWESEETYSSWAADHEQTHADAKKEIEEYLSAMGITFQRLYPLHEDMDWSDPQYADSRIALENQITYEQVFE